MLSTKHNILLQKRFHITIYCVWAQGIIWHRFRSFQVLKRRKTRFFSKFFRCVLRCCRKPRRALRKGEQYNQITFAPKKTASKTNFRKVAIPIHGQLRDGLLQALKWQNKNKAGEDYVLPSVADRYHRNPSGIQKDVRKIIHCATGLETTTPCSANGPRRKLGINLYGLHRFRHTFVFFCVEANINPEVIAAIVGHGNPVMTEHYMHIPTSAKVEAIKALPTFDRSAVKTQSPSMLRTMIDQKLDLATPDQLKAILDILNPPIEN